MGELRNTYKVLVENLKGENTGRHRLSWDDNIRKSFKEIVDWIHLTQDGSQ
jgi:hypothetical protein